MPDTRLILHVKGTENQTAEIPKNIVRAGIAQGQITRSQLIWSKDHNAWKQVRELPHLLPSQKLAPAPVPRVGTSPLPRAQAMADEPVPAGPVPKVVTRTLAAGAPAGGMPGFAKPAVKVTPADDLVVKQESGFHFMKWVCVILTILILVVVGANYLLVDQPIVSGLSRTAYAKVSVYAHLGAFVQPGALVIHLPASPGVTPAHLVDFLQVLAHNTPAAPVSRDAFNNVTLTTGWMAHYGFSGYAWKEFGDMTDEDEAHKRDFLLDQIKNASGEALVSPDGALDPGAQQAERDKVWAEFVAYFTR